MIIEKLTANLNAVRERIAEAAKLSGRTEASITLVGVTKYVDADMTRAFVNAGCTCLGENRPQVLWDKAEALSDLDIQWHMIGHLQRNKAKRTVPLAHLIHSADSLRLIKSINDVAAANDSIADILLEINVSGETAKHGFPAESFSALMQNVSEVSKLGSVRIKGLMAMAGLMGNEDDARREFAMLRELRDRLDVEFEHPSVEFTELSMGMSGDFETAIQEGATIVRVGSALFEGVK